MRSAPLALALLLGLAGAPRAAVEIESGGAFLARDGGSRADYVAGLSDQLLQLHRAGLLRGFQWYERCVDESGSAAMAAALAAYIEAEPARRAEPAARNLIWAAAETCAYP